MEKLTKSEMSTSYFRYSSDNLFIYFYFNKCYINQVASPRPWRKSSACTWAHGSRAWAWGSGGARGPCPLIHCCEPVLARGPNGLGIDKSHQRVVSIKVKRLQSIIHFRNPLPNKEENWTFMSVSVSHSFWCFLLETAISFLFHRRPIEREIL